MNIRANHTLKLWHRYQATHSAECLHELVRHYMPIVQMQTALWSHGLGRQLEPRRFDGLAEPAHGALFLPYVPPDAETLFLPS